VETKRVYRLQEKENIPGWGYWGNYGEIDIGLSRGLVATEADFQGDELHYHQKGVVFILVLEGSGQVEVEGEKLTVSKNEVLRISPGEKYRHTGATKTPFSWITICTSKDPKDKVVAE
jgi:mannose-6-phosphate isomerase-like protein (cupin superfamily)